MKKILAATPLGQIGGDPDTGLGKWSKITDLGYASKIFTDVLSRIIGIMTIIAGIFFIFQFMIGAFNFLGAGGDAKAVEKGQKYIANAILGLLILVASYAVVYVLGEILGFEILQPQKIIPFLGPGK